MDMINSQGVKLKNSFKTLREEMKNLKCELNTDLNKLESTSADLKSPEFYLLIETYWWTWEEPTDASYEAQQLQQQLEIEK